MSVVLSLNILATFFLTGLVWFVQYVHYPLFLETDQKKFWKFAKKHQEQTATVVAPMMILELITAVLLLFMTTQMNLVEAIINFLLVAGIWAATYFLQMPAQKQLTKGLDKKVIAHLIKTNWVRTIIWSVRSVFLFYILVK